MSAASDNPFSPRAALAMVLFGAGTFVLLLWMIGSGMTSGSTNDGGGHVGGRGLNGYAALASLLEKRGYPVNQTRSEAALDDPGLLVLTPPLASDAKKIAEIVEKHRYAGPTLLVLPKWPAMPVPAAMQKGKVRKGWVLIGDAMSPGWRDDIQQLGKLDLTITPLQGDSARWDGLGREGSLAVPASTQSMSSGKLIALVQDGRGQMLAGYVDDLGIYPALDDAAGVDKGKSDDDGLYPLIVVAEPDLLNNYGMADGQRAMLALDLAGAAMDGERLPINFDLTLSGYGRSANLLTLAFTPPFLAATLCLLIAALALGWRAFLRFGPPRRGGRSIAFGKRALVSNAAGLIRRTKRLHLVAPPYADHARERIARALSLPRMADSAATEAAIDRALASRSPGASPFSAIAARLRAARRPQDILRAAQELHSLERTLTR
jgi:hypothetical protein